MRIDVWMCRNVPSIDCRSVMDTLVGLVLIVVILVWALGIGALGCWLGLVVGVGSLGVVYSGLLYIAMSGVIVRLFCCMMDRRWKRR